MQSLNDDDDDPTIIRDMKKDFQSTLGGLDYRRQPSQTSFLKKQAVSMQQLFEKEYEDERNAELIKVKSQMMKLQNQYTSLQTKHKYTSAQYEQKLNQQDLDNEKDQEMLSTLKDQLQKLFLKDEELQEKLRDTRSELTRVKTDYEQKILAVQKEKYKAQVDFQELHQESHTRQHELMKDKQKKDFELNICQLKLHETEEQLQLALRRCSTVTSQQQEAEQTRLKALKAEQLVKELEKQLSELEGERTITKTMKNQLDRLNNLESENQKLKNENLYFKQMQDNVFLLREEADTMKKRLDRAELRCAHLSNLQIENKDLKEKLDKWEKLTEDTTNRHLSPVELERRFSDLQHGNVSLLERQGLLQASMHSLEESTKNKAHQLDVVQTKLTREQAQAKEAEKLIARLKHKLLLVSKERDSYKNVLDSYEKEQSSNMTLTGLRRHVNQLQDTIKGYQSHVTSLETELELKAQEMVRVIATSKELETRLNQLNQSQPSYSVEADSKVITQLREQVASLEKLLEEAQMEKSDLQLRLDRAHIQGVYEPENTKIVTLVMNPFSMARKRRREEIANIVEDNKRLKTRIELIEENHGDLDDITQIVSQKLLQSGVDSNQIQEFQDQIHSAELKNQRLMEAFKKKSHELREVIYSILGYMVQIPCDNQYKLTNMYAKSPDDFLLFQRSSDGDLQLLETEYSATLVDRMETYLTGSNSIPAFLSSLTMELFSSQTMLE